MSLPGLHRFFFQDSLFSPFSDEQLKNLRRDVDERPGLLELFTGLKDQINEYDVIDDSKAVSIFNSTKFDEYILSTSINNLHIMKAGRFDQQYSDKVNTFNWENLYLKAPSLIRLFSEKLTGQYKYVLIDSRTGFTDTSGICPMLLPQKLVVVFTPNLQLYRY